MIQGYLVWKQLYIAIISKYTSVSSTVFESLFSGILIQHKFDQC